MNRIKRISLFTAVFGIFMLARTSAFADWTDLAETAAVNAIVECSTLVYDTVSHSWVIQSEACVSGQPPYLYTED